MSVFVAIVEELVVAAVGLPRMFVAPTLTAVTMVLLVPEKVSVAVWLPCIDTEGVYPAADAGP